MASVTLVDRLDAFPPREVELGGRVFGYRSAGEGPALMLLHGIGSGSGSWVCQFEAFREQYAVVGWDAPGYGATTALAAEDPSAADYAHALADFLDVLGIARCDLVAHSLGALIGAAFARRHPRRVRSLTLASPAIGYGDAPPATRESRLAARIDAMRDLGPEGLARERAAKLLSPAADDDAVALVRWNMGRLNKDGYLQAARLLAGGRLLSDVSACDVPVFVTCGSEDRITPPESARRVARAAGSRYHELPGAGHACYIERPDDFDAAVSEFIETVHEQG